MAGQDSLPRALVRSIALCVLLGVVVGALLSAHRRATLPQLATLTAISVLYSSTIGLPAMLVFRRVRPRLSGQPGTGRRLLHLAIRVVTDYLEIERVRFGERLRFEIDVPDELRGAMIPAFAVQTVVENSVKYAVSARGTGAHIAVRARRDGGRLRLEITDDGPGFTGPIWLHGHGLDGLRARLDVLYGPVARVIAPVARPVGAGVAIELPEAREAA